MNCDYKKALEEFINKKIEFDFVFLDPPYQSDYAEDAVKIILNNNLLKENGLIVLETDNKETVINNLEKELVKIKEVKKYGRVYLLFITR